MDNVDLKENVAVTNEAVAMFSDIPAVAAGDEVPVKLKDIAGKEAFRLNTESDKGGFNHIRVPLNEEVMAGLMQKTTDRGTGPRTDTIFFVNFQKDADQLRKRKVEDQSGLRSVNDFYSEPGTYEIGLYHERFRFKWTEQEEVLDAFSKFVDALNRVPVKQDTFEYASDLLRVANDLGQREYDTYEEEYKRQRDEAERLKQTKGKE